MHGSTRLEIGWTIVPVLILVGLSAFTFYKLPTVQDVPAGALEVQVLAQQYSWTFTYPDGSHPNAKDVNTLVVPAGRAVHLSLRSTDVIHDCWIEQLGQKTDVFPDRTTHDWFRADRVGTYTGQCAEFCGPGNAFDTLWRDRQYLVMAARPVPVPSIPAAAIFQALHSLRAMDEPRHQREYSELLQRLDVTMHQDLVDLSVELQATAALKPFLDDLGIEDLTVRQGSVSEEWRHRTAVQGPGTAYLVSLVESPWRVKPLVLARAVFPSRQTLRERDLHLDDSFAGLLRAHVARWRRGLAGLPAAALKVRASRRR